jgi:glutaredoxin-related protein
LKASELNIVGKKSDLVLDMCKKLKAKKYIFGEQGINYANLKSFKDNKIDIVFQKYNHPTYPQTQGKFISHLSIIDLLFNCGDLSNKILKENN